MSIICIEKDAVTVLIGIGVQQKLPEHIFPLRAINHPLETAALDLKKGFQSSVAAKPCSIN